ncbi:oxidoreductase [Aquimarina sp. MMG016]|uniref:WD40/YVTN/BNR-like repeat-containing protein n=1 Tax=Aquimarina sp. MMG016 TaxID=2822690 RepID=UPI001B3A1C61|nr:oxidoreductase [Aquimarina sp. MMG016]MBQ4821810.1 oxidoreductase [Aquimarina sp. MMG016]
MRIFYIVFVISFFVSCTKEKVIEHNFSKVKVDTIFQDSISIRAIAVDENLMIYTGTNGKYGYFEFNKDFKNGNPLYSFFTKKKKGILNFEDKKPSFRAVANTETDFFVMSIESPALLYKINKQSGKVKLVYTEKHEKAFYDSMAFWNDREGIAMGDPTEGCLSIIITRDGGERWNKVSCDNLPKTIEGEAAFAASNGNISIIGNKAWIVTGGLKSRVFYSADKGNTWEVFETPIIQGTPTSGAYSVDFYDEVNGVIFGGDYTKPDSNSANKVITNDGGKTWKLIADGVTPGYKSCIRYIPHSGAKEMIAVGFTGISISNDYGEHWKELSKESFYTLRFINDSTAIAAGKNRIAKLVFK